MRGARAARVWWSDRRGFEFSSVDGLCERCHAEDGVCGEGSWCE
ncbi:hypothetical protein BVRB_008850 [Beta vulgaris subsp. vulgaris]|uniref:Uncharacterized protein n=1 Tax=Beta vulgaris subsp. vulgaris TaxID=3555 RepID=A0A0J8B666_BETVV|nr:hypothetical protein BVRB_008850 [Beta vulgaris subsp. vulgaris]